MPEFMMLGRPIGSSAFELSVAARLAVPSSRCEREGMAVDRKKE
jgi:hypothetical protein